SCAPRSLSRRASRCRCRVCRRRPIWSRKLQLTRRIDAAPIGVLAGSRMILEAGPMSSSELKLLAQLRAKARARVAPLGQDIRSLGERAADGVAAIMGSWGFVIAQSIILFVWIAWNTVTGRGFDPYPFILLNLALSFQAAYSAPIIMMS